MPICAHWRMSAPLKSGGHKNRKKSSTSSPSATLGSTLKRGRNMSDTSVSTNASLNTSGRTFRRSQHGNGSGTSLAASAQAASGYRALYHRLPSVQACRPPDLIYFRKGHTLEKHLQAIGRTKEEFNGQFQSYLVSRHMGEEELERVRRDPGVEKVVQVTNEMEEVERGKDRSLVKAYDRGGPADGYLVSFFKPPLSLKLHFLRIRQRFDNVKDLEDGCYYVECPESKLERIFSDPNVALIEQDSYGTFC